MKLKSYVYSKTTTTTKKKQSYNIIIIIIIIKDECLLKYDQFTFHCHYPASRGYIFVVWAEATFGTTAHPAKR